MVIKGKFIGETSCGFIKGRIYNISIMPLRKSYIGVTVIPARKGLLIGVKDLFDSGFCLYISIQTLANNWEIPVDDDE